MRSLFGSRPIRFAIVGGVNTLFGFFVYSLLALTALPTWAVLTLTNIVAISFNFVASGGIVFHDLRARRIPGFIAAYGLVFVINWFLIDTLTPLAGDRIRAMAIIVLPVAVLSYVLQSKLVFRVADVGSREQAARQARSSRAVSCHSDHLFDPDQHEVDAVQRRRKPPPH